MTVEMSVRITLALSSKSFIVKIFFLIITLSFFAKKDDNRYIYNPSAGTGRQDKLKLY